MIDHNDYTKLASYRRVQEEMRSPSGEEIPYGGDKETIGILQIEAIEADN